MKTILLLVIVFHLSEQVNFKKICDPQVRTRCGMVEGVTKTLFSGKQVEAYLGIPYAAPPTGHLRFAPPQPPSPWNGTLQAKTKPCSCYQAASETMKQDLWFVSGTHEKEDCLFLNVWVPKTNIPIQKLAVIVWIHGVAGIAGSSNLELYDGSVLASEENVIVVSINYRLSVFGFLYLDLPEAPGNVGMLDQLAALHWVQDNINMFRGDPDRVTIFGETFVGFHLLSHNSWSLFKNAIITSGPPNSVDSSISKEAAMEQAYALSKNLGCSMCSPGQHTFLDCLRQRSPSELIAAYRQIPENLRSPFAPVRNDLEVPMHPEMSGMLVPPEHKKNCLLGTTSENSAIFLKAYFPNTTLAENTRITEDDLGVLLRSLYHFRDDRLVKQCLFQYKNRDEPYNPMQVRSEAIHLVTDVTVLCDMNKFADQYASHENHVYQYHLTHRPSRAIKKPTPAWAGSVRGDDLAFVFGVPLNPKEGYSRQEVQFAKQVMTYWANFAKTGNPNSVVQGGKRYTLSAGGQREVTWPQYTLSDKRYLQLDDTATEQKSRLRERQCSFWHHALPDLVALQSELWTLKGGSSTGK